MPTDDIFLILGFTSLVQHIDAGKISQTALDKAILCFDCDREYLCGNPTELEDFLEDEGVRPYVHRTIMDAVIKAEEEKRAIWGMGKEGKSYEELNRLLQQHGFPPLKTDNPRYLHAQVAVTVAVQDLRLKVIWGFPNYVPTAH